MGLLIWHLRENVPAYVGLSYIETGNNFGRRNNLKVLLGAWIVELPAKELNILDFCYFEKKYQFIFC